MTESCPSYEIVSSWPRYEWQVRASEAFFSRSVTGHRYFVWVMARQVGKTALLKAICLDQVQRVPDTYWYAAPSYDRSEEVYLECCDALGELIDERLVFPKQTKAGWVIRFSKSVTGGVPAALHFKSLGNPEMLRGATLRGLVVDEAGLIMGSVFRKILVPMLRVKDGWCVLAGTPPEDDESPDPRFFRGCWERASSGEDGRWWGITGDYRAHPDPRVRADIESDRPYMTESEFAREYLALFPEEEEYRLPAVRLWGPRSALSGTGPGALPDGLTIQTGVDLADNEREMGDRASVVTWAISLSGDVYVLAAEYYKNPSEVLDALYMHKAMFGIMAVKIQNSAFDKGFRLTIEAAAPSRGFLPVVPVDIGGVSKHRRIILLEPLARRQALYVQEDLRDLLLEWEQFPDGLVQRGGRYRRSNHYDMLDALSVCAQDAVDAAHWQPAAPRKRNTFKDAVRASRMRRLGYSRDRVERAFQIK